MGLCKKRMRTMAAVMSVLMIVLGIMMSIPAAAADPGVTVIVNGQVAVFPDAGPVIVDSRTMVPVRFVSESLGFGVEWDGENREVHVHAGETEVLIPVGKRWIRAGDEYIVTDTESVIMNSRTMVPLRALAEITGSTVDWFPDTKTVVVTSRESETGEEASLFRRFLQSGLFDLVSGDVTERLVPKGCSGDGGYPLYIERVTDRESLYREELDCSLIVRSFDRETLMTVKGLLHAPYPTEHGKVWDIICDAAAGRIWQTFYEKTSELYPLYSALPPRAGTFGSYYYDGREVETYMDPSSRSLIVNFNTAGKVNPDVPETLTEEEIRFLTEDAGTSLFFRNISEIKG